jgi:hypothetical protein
VGELYQQIAALPGVYDRPWRNKEKDIMGQGIIAFDIDGVLANFTRGFTRIAHQLYGTPVGDTESQQTWNFEEFPELRLDKVKAAFDGPVWTAVKTSPDFWARLDPKNPSVMPRINRIANKVFITNRPGINTKEQSIQFLETWGIENPRVIVVDGHNKGDIAIHENVVAVIDDLYKNVVDIHKAVANCYTALLYCAYNKVHHDEWLHHHCGDVVLSVDQFIDECYDRKLVVDVSYEDSDTVDARIQEILHSL